jgi:N-methylhydantoinase B
VAGGDPGSLQSFVLVHDGRDLAARHLDELAGEAVVLAPKGTVQLAADDVFVHFYGGGGGLGDPLERPADEVARDVRQGLVTAAAARGDYFTVLEPGGDVDEAATDAVRAGERRRRLAGAGTGVQTAAGRRLSRHTRLDGDTCSCAHCGRVWGTLGDGIKPGLLVEEVPIPERWPRAGSVTGAERFVIRRFRCPGCATQVETEVNRAGAPFVTSFDA